MVQPAAPQYAHCIILWNRCPIRMVKKYPAAFKCIESTRMLTRNYIRCMINVLCLNAFPISFYAELSSGPKPKLHQMLQTIDFRRQQHALALMITTSFPVARQRLPVNQMPTTREHDTLRRWSYTQSRILFSYSVFCTADRNEKKNYYVYCLILTETFLHLYCRFILIFKL